MVIFREPGVCLVSFFFSSRRRHTRCYRYWSSDVCSSDLIALPIAALPFNDVKINYEFRDLAELLVFNTTTVGVNTISALVFMWLHYSPTTGQTSFTINNKIGRESCRDRVLIILVTGGLVF